MSVDLRAFGDAVMALYLRRQYAKRFDLPEKSVFVWCDGLRFYAGFVVNAPLPPVEAQA